MKATDWIPLEKCRELEQAIAQVEGQTECEFVCAVATRSSAYESATKWWSLLGALFGVLAMGTIAHANQPTGDWMQLDSLPLVPSILGLLLGFVTIAAGVHRLPALLMLFTTEAEKRKCVERAAGLLFCKHGVSHTVNRVGVLFYISLAERKFVVIADRAANECLGPDGVAKLVEAGTRKLAEGGRAEAFQSCLQLAGEMLQETFPCKPDDQNELQNHLVVVHPFP